MSLKIKVWNTEVDLKKSMVDYSNKELFELVASFNMQEGLIGGHIDEYAVFYDKLRREVLRRIGNCGLI